MSFTLGSPRSGESAVAAARMPGWIERKENKR